MDVGILTVPLKDKSLEEVMDFAESVGIGCLEIISNPGSPHLDPATFTKKDADRIRGQLDERALTVSALAYYDPRLTNPEHTKAHQEHAKKVIDAAAMLNVDVVCMLAGHPAEGMTKHETIERVLPKAFKPILAHARKKNVVIALENWWKTCLQGIDTFQLLFDTIPDDNFGLNYDPSHLYHQQCDYLAPVGMFADRIFHTHAKDTLVDRARLAEVGVHGTGWWRYVIPGFGNITWGEYISHLRQAGYDGVLSIEHEDKAHTVEEGFVRGAAFLEPYC